MSDTVKIPPVPCASLMVRSATWICGPTRKAVSGRTTLEASAPATVNDLKVEPGSYVKPTARFTRAHAGASSTRFASTLGQFAIASRSPVRGSITIAVAPLGW